MGTRGEHENVIGDNDSPFARDNLVIRIDGRDFCVDVIVERSINLLIVLPRKDAKPLSERSNSIFLWGGRGC